MRCHDPLGGHARRVDVADYHGRLKVCGLLELRDRDGRVESHATGVGAAATFRSTATIAPNVWLVGLAGRCGARRRGGAGNLAPRARMSTIVPVESSAAGAKPASRKPVSTSEIGACETADGRCEQPHLQLFRRGCGDRLRRRVPRPRSARMRRPCRRAAARCRRATSSIR